MTRHAPTERTTTLRGRGVHPFGETRRIPSASRRSYSGGGGVASSPGRTTNSAVRPDRWFDLQGRVRVLGRKALVLGIDYRGQRRSVEGACNTARELIDLLHRFGFAGEIRALLEDSGQGSTRPTLQNIVSSLGWLSEDLDDGDEVYLFYIGLGGYASKLSKTHALAPLDHIQEGLLSEADIADLLSSSGTHYRANIVCDSGFGGTILEGVSKIWCEDSGVGSSVQKRSSGSPRRSRHRGSPEIVVLSGARDEASFEHAIGHPGQLLPAYIAAVETLVSDTAAGGGGGWRGGTPCDFTFYDLLPRIRAELQASRCSLVPQFSSSSPGFDWAAPVLSAVDQEGGGGGGGVRSGSSGRRHRHHNRSGGRSSASPQRDAEELARIRAFISSPDPVHRAHSPMGYAVDTQHGGPGYPTSPLASPGYAGDPASTMPHPLHEASRVGWSPGRGGSPCPPDYIHRAQIQHERLLLEKEIEKALEAKRAGMSGGVGSTPAPGNMKVVIDAPKNCRIDFQCEPASKGGGGGGKASTSATGSPHGRSGSSSKRRSRSREGAGGGDGGGTVPPLSTDVLGVPRSPHVVAGVGSGKSPGLLSATVPQFTQTQAGSGHNGGGAADVDVVRKPSFQETQASDDLSAWGGVTTGSNDVAHGTVRSRVALFENREDSNTPPTRPLVHSAAEAAADTVEEAQFLDAATGRQVTAHVSAMRDADSASASDEDVEGTSDTNETEGSHGVHPQRRQKQARAYSPASSAKGTPRRPGGSQILERLQAEQAQRVGGAHDEHAKQTLREVREREKQIAKMKVERFKRKQEVHTRAAQSRAQLELERDTQREQLEYDRRLARHAERVYSYSRKRGDGRDHIEVTPVPASPAAHRYAAAAVAKGEAMATGSPVIVGVASPARRASEKKISQQRQRITTLQSEATDLLDLHMIQRRALEMQLEALQEVSSVSQHSDRSATPEAVNTYVQTLPDVLRRDALRILREYEQSRGGGGGAGGASPSRRTAHAVTESVSPARTPYNPNTPAGVHLQLHDVPQLDRVRELQQAYSPPHPQSVNGRSIRFMSPAAPEIEVVERSCQTTAEDLWHIAKGKDFAVYKKFYRKLRNYVAFRKVQRLGKKQLASPSPEPQHAEDPADLAEEAAEPEEAAAEGEWVWNEETQDYDWVEAAAAAEEGEGEGGEWVWNEETQDYDWVEAAAAEAEAGEGGEWVWNEETQDYDWVEAAAAAAEGEGGEWVWNEETQDYDWVEAAAAAEEGEGGEWVWNEETQDYDWVEAAAAEAAGEWVWNEETQDHEWVESGGGGEEAAAEGGEWVWNEETQEYDWVES